MLKNLSRSINYQEAILVLQHRFRGCDGCIESNSCEFSSEFCPKAVLDHKLESDLAADPVFKKYQEFYQRLKN